jgi:DNA primase
LKGIPPEVISEVRNRAGIEDVVSEVVTLKKAGAAYRGLCPFHTEKTPSFHVYPEKGFFVCFGCNERGDVFAFVQKTKNVQFPESVRYLAQKYGVELPESTEDRREFDKRSLILLLYQQASEYFRRLLQDPAQGLIAREYLQARGVTEEIIDRFQLGYAPQGWDGLLTYLMQSAKVSAETLAEAGLVRHKAETNRYYDLFRHRLMVPIHDEQGRVIAFGGRTLADDQVKYINSPENPIYIKGDHLYAFHQAKDNIKQKDSVIVVEGYFDAITAHQYGFTNAVATLGTALTERQARLLVRFTDSKRVFLCFDADNAGERAVTRGTETIAQIAEGIGIELRVIRVPGGKDPDECLRSAGEHGGPEAFCNAIEHAPTMIDYELERAMAASDTTSHSGRIDAARHVVPVLAQIKNNVARGEYIRQWAMRLGLREDELMSDVGQYRRNNRIGTAPSHNPQPDDKRMRMRAAQKNAPKAGYIEAERHILALYLMSHDDHELVRETVMDDRFVDPVHQRIKEAIEGVGKFNNVDDLQFRLMDRLGPDSEASAVLVDVILKVQDLTRQNLPREVILKEARARILQEKLLQAKSRLRALLPTASSDEEQELLQSRIMQLRQLETQALQTAQTDDEIADLRRKIDSLLLETTK